MAAREIVTKVWEQRVNANDPDAVERGIRQDGVRDWRDADVVIPLNELRVYSLHEAFRMHQAAREPDWDQGWEVRSNTDNRTVFSGKGQPPDWIARALRDGLTIEGVIVLRDRQQHG